MNSTRALVLLLAFLSPSIGFLTVTEKLLGQTTPAPSPAWNMIFPWPLGSKWPALNTYWNYEMQVQILHTSPDKNYVYGLRVTTDSISQRSRQDVYYGPSGTNIDSLYMQRPFQTVISDYKFSTIMELGLNKDNR